MKAVRHFGIVVRDMERSLLFYRDLLSLRIVSSMAESGAHLEQVLGLPNVRVHTVKMTAENGSALVELLEFESHPDESPQPRTICSLGPTHVAFTVENLDAVFGRLSRQGVRFNSPPQRVPDGRAKVAFCRDPDGTPVELVEVLK